MGYIVPLAACVFALLLANPAMCMGCDKGGMKGHHGWDMALVDISEEEMNNMTLAELDQLKEQKMQEMQNMTLAEIKALHDERFEEINNMTPDGCRYGEPMSCGGGEDRFIGPEMRNRGDRSMMGGNPAEMSAGFLGKMPELCGCRDPMWLVDDISAEDLENMTLAEVDALRQQKLEAMKNMTLGEIKLLREKKMEEMQNMTLGELKGHGKCMMSFLGMGPVGGQMGFGGCR